MFFESFVLNVVILLVIIVALTFDYITKFFSYWYVRHIPYKTPVPLLGSDFERVFGLANTADVIKKLYNKYPRDKYVGYIKSRIPELIVRDPETIKLILCDDFNNFHNRGLCLDKTEDLYMKNNLFYAESETWHALKSRVHTYFVSNTAWSNMIGKSCEKLEEILPNYETELNVREFVGSLMTQVLNDFVFGENTLTGDQKKIISSLTAQIQQDTIVTKIKNYIRSIFPSVYVLFGMKTFHTDLLECLKKLISQTVVKDENTYLHFLNKQKQAGPMDLTIQSKHRKPKLNLKDFDNEVMTSQILSFLGEGYVPCYNAVALTLYELAKDASIQEKVISEIDQLNVNERELDKLNGATLLDNVVKEVLRLHPMYRVLSRTCVATYKIPNTNIVIDKGVTVTIPVAAIHADETYFKHPDTFDPSRFADEESQKRHPYAYLPYGAGRRSCLGERLAQQMIKSCVYAILRSHRVSSCARTPRSATLTDTAFSTTLNRDIWIKITPRQHA